MERSRRRRAQGSDRGSNYVPVVIAGAALVIMAGIFMAFRSSRSRQMALEQDRAAQQAARADRALTETERTEAAARATTAPDASEAPKMTPIKGDYFVSPEGDDSKAGSGLAPVRSLERVRDLVRKDPKRGKEPITVILAGGRHFITDTLALTEKDSGTEGAPVIYSAAPGVEVIFDGGKILPPSACKPVSDASMKRRLVSEVAADIRVIDLAPLQIAEYGEFGPRGFSRSVKPAPNELFVNGKPQRIAKWPNKDRIKLGKVVDGGSIPRHGEKPDRPATFKYETDRAKRWAEADDFYVSGIFGQAWADDAIKVAKLDTKAGTITTVGPHLYGFRNRNFTTWCAVNLLEEIDLPGEYYVDRKTEKLYFLPDTENIEQVQISVLTKPFVTLNGASHVTIRGITFENSRGRGIDVKNGTGVRIISCTLRNLGGRAVAVSGGTRHLVRGCDVYNTGSGGVTIAGGDRKTLTPSLHRVENCDIQKVNRWYWTYKPCVAVNGVGNVVRHNYLHHVPGQAILMGGNDHLIEFNEIGYCVTDMSDMGSIYTGRNSSVLGHVIRYNFFHHMDDSLGHGAGVQAIFIDDDNLYTAVIYGNVFYKTGSNAAIKFNGGGGTSIANNIFVDCPRPVQGGDKKHVDRAIKRIRDPNWKHKTFQKVTKEVDIRKDPYKSRHPYLLDTFANGFNYGTPFWNNYDVKGDHSQFVDARELNFALKPGSPVLKTETKDVFDKVFGADHETVKFEKIPFERIGPTKDRASYPGDIIQARYLPPVYKKGLKD